MLRVDCHELTLDEQLALAGAITGGLGGRAVALIRDDDIVFDQLSGGPPDPQEIQKLVLDFVARRKDSQHYSVERDGDTVIVRSPDPLARSRGKKHPGLPENVLQCPLCAFVTPYQEMYDVHLRSHYFGTT